MAAPALQRPQIRRERTLHRSIRSSTRMVCEIAAGLLRQSRYSLAPGMTERQVAKVATVMVLVLALAPRFSRYSVRSALFRYSCWALEGLRRLSLRLSSACSQGE